MVSPGLVSTCKTRPLLVSLVVPVHDSCLAIPLYNPTKWSVMTICEPGHEKTYLLVFTTRSDTNQAVWPQNLDSKLEISDTESRGIVLFV